LRKKKIIYIYYYIYNVSAKKSIPPSFSAEICEMLRFCPILKKNADFLKKVGVRCTKSTKNLQLYDRGANLSLLALKTCNE